MRNISHLQTRYGPAFLEGADTEAMTAATLSRAPAGGFASAGPESLGWKLGVGYVRAEAPLALIPTSPNPPVSWNPEDKELAGQWHYALLGDFQSIWSEYRGAGVHVGVYDSGIQEKHWDLDDNLDQSLEVKVGGKTYDGDYRPFSGPHGTSVAGLIAAERNGEGTVGLAHEASLTGVNIFDPYSGGGLNPGIFVNAENPAPFFEAIRQSYTMDVANHSWGLQLALYQDGGSREYEGSFAASMVEAVTYASEHGRDGLGTISVFAAGNYARDGHGESERTDRHFVAVGAYRDDGLSSNYSTRGAHLLVSAPSDDFAELGGRGIVTTDLLGRDGYNTPMDPGGDHDQTNSFGGTSAATPQVTGLVALMLDAAPELGWRDVHNILAASAKAPAPFETGPVVITEVSESGYVSLTPFNESQFQLTGKGANWNGGGMHYSSDYGYGGIDVHAAVRMAEAQVLIEPAQTSANEQHYTTGNIATDLKTDKGQWWSYDPELYTTNFTGFAGEAVGTTFNVSTNIEVEHVDLLIDYKTGYDYDTYRNYSSMSGARFKLTAPDGTYSFLDTMGANATYDLTADSKQTYTLGFVGFRGVDANGTWKLEVESPEMNTFFELKSFKLDIYGGAASANSVHTYTDEFFSMATVEGQGARRTLADKDGGIDWVNLAAVTSDINLSLAAKATTKFGAKDAFTIASGSVIENAIAGDGNDRLVGNSITNVMYGMRGNDRLSGAAGNDTLFGGVGNDWLDGGAGNDRLSGGAGDDIFYFDNKKASGTDRITDFEKGDRLMLTAALRDNNHDGIITFGSNGVLNVSSSGRVALDGVDPQQGLVYLGMEDGFYVYSLASAGPADLLHA